MCQTENGAGLIPARRARGNHICAFSQPPTNDSKGDGSRERPATYDGWAAGGFADVRPGGSTPSRRSNVPQALDHMRRLAILRDAGFDSPSLMVRLLTARGAIPQNLSRIRMGFRMAFNEASQAARRRLRLRRPTKRQYSPSSGPAWAAFAAAG